MATASNPLVDVDRYTGEYISGWPRIKQSVETILTTRVGTRLMRLWWGSEMADMMDKPQIQEVFARGILSACTSINKYEPEFKVTTVSLTPSYDGTTQCVVYGKNLLDGTKQQVSVTLYPVG